MDREKRMNYLLGLVLLTVTFCSCGQTKNSVNMDGLVINPKIKDEAEKNIKNLKAFEKANQGFQVFENKVTFEFYENDSLILSSQDKPRSIMFKSFYLWKGDTLFIEGGIGLFGGGGFSIAIINGKATVYHMLSSDESPMYAYGDKTKLLDRLEVACHDVTAIISEVPEKWQSKVIYGYVEFKSDTYYTSQGTVDGKEAGPRKKTRSNMKMYFRSGEVKI